MLYLSVEFLLGVHTAGRCEGVVQQDEGVALHVEGQVRTRGEENTGGEAPHVVQFIGTKKPPPA